MQIKVGSSILKFIAGDHLETSYHEEIYRLMTTDALTQTWNRRYLTEALDRELNRSARYDRPLSLITFDIDHFKKINDAWGHVAGDAVLRQLAGAIKAKLRHDGQEIRCTISVGISAFDVATNSVDLLYQAADVAVVRGEERRPQPLRRLAPAGGGHSGPRCTAPESWSQP